MDHRRFHRVRALLLLVAFGLGIIGQTTAVLAMPMDHNPVGSSKMMPGNCSGCPGTGDDMSLAPACAITFCANLPSAAQAPVVDTPTKAIYPLIASDVGPGIAVPPDPGPPKPLHHR